MSKKEIFGEQLTNDVATSAANVGIDNVSPDSHVGSPLGKFKDVESLMTAYNNLQSEFTKKCQALNDLLKSNSKKDNVDNTPFYENENWQEQVDNFFNNYPNAKEHSKAIAEYLASDKTTGSLELAYSKVLEGENVRLNYLLKDQGRIMDLITPEIKEQIIKDYLKGVNKMSPYLIASNGGDKIISSYKKPINLVQAGEMAKKIFK